MKYIIGLGNPGKKFEGTRHNAGFMLVDYLAGEEKWQESKRGKLQHLQTDINNKEAELVKPMTFMNNSGLAVVSLKKKYPRFESGDIFVVHDDLDIPLGEYKIHFAKGPKLHKGLKSIEDQLKTKDFWRVRIGIENRKDDKISGEDYVLQNFSKTEMEVVKEIIKKASQELKERL